MIVLLCNDNVISATILPRNSFCCIVFVLYMHRQLSELQANDNRLFIFTRYKIFYLCQQNNILISGCPK